MPITRAEFEKGRTTSELEKAVVAYLRAHANQAFSQTEIFHAVYQSGLNFFEDLGNSLAMRPILTTLVREKRILRRDINFVDYYAWNPASQD